MAADEESFLAEICYGGGIWTNEVFPLGKALEEVKVWAISQARKAHAGFEVIFVKMQKYNKKFDQFVDIRNLLDQIQDGDRIRVLLQVARLVDEPLHVDITCDNDTDEATPASIDSLSPAGPRRLPKKPPVINCSPHSATPPKILADAGFTPNRNPTAAKYAKYFFGDSQAIDIDSVLSQMLDATDLEELLKQFTEERYRDAREHAENEKARKRLVRNCAHWLMANCNESDNPTIMEKSIMAYSIWRRFPFFSSAPSDKNALPYTIIYDPFGYKGYLGNAIANKRQTKFGSACGRKRKLIQKLDTDSDIVEEDSDLSNVFRI